MLQRGELGRAPRRPGARARRSRHDRRRRSRQDPADLVGATRSRRPARSPRRRTRSRSRPASTRSGSREIRATRSPASTPAAIRPLATPRTSARKSAAVTSAQPSVPGPAAEDDGVAGARRRCVTTSSVRLPVAGTRSSAGWSTRARVLLGCLGGRPGGYGDGRRGRLPSSRRRAPDPRTLAASRQLRRPDKEAADGRADHLDDRRRRRAGRRHGGHRRLRRLPRVGQGREAGRGRRGRPRRPGATRCSSCSTPRRSRTSTRSPTSGTATTRSPGPWSRARCSGAGRRLHPARPGRRPTEVTYRLAVDVSIPMIGMLKRKAEKIIIDTALKGLKKRVESLADAVDGPCASSSPARAGSARPPRPPAPPRSPPLRPAHAGAVHRRRALARPTRSAWPSGAEPTEVAERLWVQQVDAQRRFEQSWAEIQGYLLTVLDAPGSTRSRPRS